MRTHLVPHVPCASAKQTDEGRARTFVRLSSSSPLRWSDFDLPTCTVLRVVSSVRYSKQNRGACSAHHAATLKIAGTVLIASSESVRQFVLAFFPSGVL
jgi:hypothetical protein